MSTQIPAAELLGVTLTNDASAAITWTPYTAEGFYAVSGEIQAKDKHGLFVFAHRVDESDLAGGSADAIIAKKLHPGTYDCSLVVTGYDAPYEPGVPFQEEHGSWSRSNIIQLDVNGGNK